MSQHGEEDAMSRLLSVAPVPIKPVQIPSNIYNEINQLFIGYPMTYDGYAMGQITKDQLITFVRRAFSEDLQCRYTFDGKPLAKMKRRDEFLEKWMLGGDTLSQFGSLLFHAAQPMVVLDYNEETQEVIGRLNLIFHAKDRKTGKLRSYAEECRALFRREDTWKISAYIVAVTALKSDSKSKL